MDELTIEKPKRRSGYRRIKEQRKYLFDDIAALESLVGTLLGHLDRATQPGITEHERAHLRGVAQEIRAALDDNAPHTEITAQ